MAKSMIFTPSKLEKIKPNSGLQRRNSTGGAAVIFSQPNPIPNYLRASIGSCHDLCKYGIRRDSPPEESSRTRNINTRPEAKSTTSNRGKKVPETKNLVPASSRKQPNETSKSTCNARASRNDEGKKPSVRIPASKTSRRSKSVPRKVLKSESQKLLESSEVPKKVLKYESQKLLESSERCTKTDQCEITVAEKIIHVVEANDRNQNEDLVSSRDQKQEMDSAANNLSQRKLDLKREEVNVERESKEEEEDGWKERRLRRVVSEGDFEHKKNERLRVIVIGKDKVKALVDTFETLMSTQDYYDGSRTCSSSA